VERGSLLSHKNNSILTRKQCANKWAKYILT
jgi:hypothetical protein